jgi:cold shock protein
MNETQKGTIKFIGTRGFGFILPDGAQADEKGIFFHRTNTVDDKFEELREGQQVEFMIENTEKGPQAVAVAAV